MKNISIKEGDALNYRKEFYKTLFKYSVLIFVVCAGLIYGLFGAFLGENDTSRILGSVSAFTNGVAIFFGIKAIRNEISSYSTFKYWKKVLDDESNTLI